MSTPRKSTLIKRIRTAILSIVEIIDPSRTPVKTNVDEWVWTVAINHTGDNGEIKTFSLLELSLGEENEVYGYDDGKLTVNITNYEYSDVADILYMLEQTLLSLQK